MLVTKIQFAVTFFVPSTLSRLKVKKSPSVPNVFARIVAGCNTAKSDTTRDLVKRQSYESKTVKRT